MAIVLIVSGILVIGWKRISKLEERTHSIRPVWCDHSHSLTVPAVEGNIDWGSGIIIILKWTIKSDDVQIDQIPSSQDSYIYSLNRFLVLEGSRFLHQALCICAQRYIYYLLTESDGPCGIESAMRHTKILLWQQNH